MRIRSRLDSPLAIIGPGVRVVVSETGTSRCRDYADVDAASLFDHSLTLAFCLLKPFAAGQIDEANLAILFVDQVI